MSKKSTLVFLSLLALPAIALAAEGAKFEAVIFSEQIERFVEIINLVVALFAGIYAIKLAALSQGGTMEKTWNTLAVATVSFVLLEVVGTLKGFEVVEIEGLAEIFEFLFVTVLAYCLYFTKADLLKKMLGK